MYCRAKFNDKTLSSDKPLRLERIFWNNKYINSKI